MKTVRYFYAGILVQIILFASATHTLAQTTDSTYIISSTDKRSIATPPNLSNNPFYDLIRPNKQGLRPTILYSSDDRIFVGLHYNSFSKNWSPDSSGHKHKIYTNYSISQKALSFGYQEIIQDAFKNWNLFLDANYDWVRWTNFYGLGNETKEVTDNRDYYRIRSREASLSVGLQRRIGRQSRLIISPFYQRFQLLNDVDRFLSTDFFTDSKPANFKAKNFGGVYTILQLQNLNDMLLPTKGLIFTANIGHIRNMTEPRSFTNYSFYTRVFIPFLKHFVFSTENGAATLTGEPEFYQLNSIGGNSLRGYRRDRFWGETVFHNNTEVQYIFDVKNKLLNGKMGVLAFFDQGRVWKKGERSNTWHQGYGGGIMMVPFNKLYFSVQYGISPERKGFHFEFRRSL